MLCLRLRFRYQWEVPRGRWFKLLLGISMKGLKRAKRNTMRTTFWKIIKFNHAWQRSDLKVYKQQKTRQLSKFGINFKVQNHWFQQVHFDSCKLGSKWGYQKYYKHQLGINEFQAAFFWGVFLVQFQWLEDGVIAVVSNNSGEKPGAGWTVGWSYVVDGSEIRRSPAEVGSLSSHTLW